MNSALTLAELLTLGGVLANLAAVLIAYNKLQVSNERRFTVLETQMGFLLNRSHNSRPADSTNRPE